MAKQREIEETFNELVKLVEAQQRCLETSDRLISLKELRVEMLEAQNKNLSKINRLLAFCFSAIIVIDIILAVIKLI
jgi:hypothetical protein